MYSETVLKKISNFFKANFCKNGPKSFEAFCGKFRPKNYSSILVHLATWASLEVYFMRPQKIFMVL